MTYTIIMPKVTVPPKEMCKVRTFFKNEKNAGKIMMTVDKPQLKAFADSG